MRFLLYENHSGGLKACAVLTEKTRKNDAAQKISQQQPAPRTTAGTLFSGIRLESTRRAAYRAPHRRHRHRKQASAVSHARRQILPENRRGKTRDFTLGTVELAR